MQVDSTPTKQSVASPITTGSIPDDRLGRLELDPLAAAYKGRSKIILLNSIANLSVALRGPALALALQTTRHSTLDTATYELLFQQYRAHINKIEAGELTSPQALDWFASHQGKLVTLDRAWLDKAKREATQINDKLEVELRGYTTNLIKESIRMGYRDLAEHQYRTGDLAGATRYYTKSRDYCTTPSHVLEMCNGIIQVSLDHGQYTYVRNYVLKAESALESLNAANAKPKGSAAVLLPGMVAPAPDAAEVAKEREFAETAERLRLASGLAHLGTGQFDKAALAFCASGGTGTSGGPNSYIPPGAHAVYATLTALASFSRGQVRTSLLENGDLRAAFEAEPWAREAARAVVNARYRDAWEGLIENQARALVDPHLHPHVLALLGQIRSRLLCAYFAPYSSVALGAFADAFGCAEETLTAEVVGLIRAGRMPARVDAREGRLVKKETDVREKAFRRALEEGEGIMRRGKASQLRMKLIAADLVVKAPKEKAATSTQAQMEISH